MPWTPSLSVGVTMIDNQHKIWFEKAEKLFEAGKNNMAKEYIGELLDFLDSYTKEHFAMKKNICSASIILNTRIRKRRIPLLLRSWQNSAAITVPRAGTYWCSSTRTR